MKFEESKTFENLQKAFQGEAMAHLKYQFYRSQLSDVSKDIENILNEIIHNEKEHGKIWFKLLNGGTLSSDIDNLEDAIFGEEHEAYQMYPEFSRIAKEEGFEDIAQLFEEVAAVEELHSIKFSDILKNIKEKTIFKDKNVKAWKCLNCGFVHFGKMAPSECPVCKHPQKYFVRDNSWDTEKQ